MTTPDAISEARRQLLEKLRRGELPGSNGALEPLNSRPPGGPTPLSPGQEQVWFHHQLAAPTPIYNESVTIHRRGPLDPVILERCFNEIVRRHEIWRSAFPISNGTATQRIDSNVRVFLPLVDLSHLSVEEREAEAVRIATEDVRRPFDLDVAPLFRARLVRCAADYHRIYLTVHHLVFDGVSIYRVLIRELAALYSAYSAGLPSPLPELTVQYGDYAAWKQKRLANGIHDAELGYWRETLSENPPRLELPTDRPRPAEATWQGGMETCSIPGQLIERLKELGRSEGLTPYMMVLAAFQVLLYRYSGRDDIIVGGATNTRTRPEFEPLIGYFLNTVVFRSQIGTDLTFREFLGRVKNTVLGALAHSEIPFDAIVRELAPKRDSSRHPLFQVLFSMRPPFTDFPDGWDVTDMEVHSGASSFDLFVEFSEHPQALSGTVRLQHRSFRPRHDPALAGEFSSAAAKSWLQTRTRPSRAFRCSPSANGRRCWWIGTTPVRASPAVAFTSCSRLRWRRVPITRRLFFAASSLTYADLNACSNKLAHYLRQNGAASGSLVGVYMERSFEMVCGASRHFEIRRRLRALRPGAAVISPEHDARGFPPRVRDHPAKVERQLGRLCRTQRCRSIPAWKLSSFSRTRIPRIPVEPRDAIYAIYTSGSTGVPKAAINTHEAVANRILWMQDRYPLEAGDRVLQKTPLQFRRVGWGILLAHYLRRNAGHRGAGRSQGCRLSSPT